MRRAFDQTYSALGQMRSAFDQVLRSLSSVAQLVKCCAVDQVDQTCSAFGQMCRFAKCALQWTSDCPNAEHSGQHWDIFLHWLCWMLSLKRSWMSCFSCAYLIALRWLCFTFWWNGPEERCSGLTDTSVIVFFVPMLPSISRSRVFEIYKSHIFRQCR